MDCHKLLQCLAMLNQSLHCSSVPTHLWRWHGLPTCLLGCPHLHRSIWHCRRCEQHIHLYASVRILVPNPYDTLRIEKDPLVFPRIHQPSVGSNYLNLADASYQVT
jgi:hypothetical protein